MKRSLSLSLVSFFFLVLASLNATARAEDIALGEPGYGGTGCPGGSASVTLSPDNKSMSIIFDQYVAEAGGITGRSIDRKSCNLAIPVHVPNGISVSVFKIDYRGFTAIPMGGQGRFNVEYFFAGSRGPAFTKTFPGGTNTDYFLTNTLPAVAEVWSPCGADVNLRVNSSMLVRSNFQFDDALASVDSVDVNAGIIFHLRFRRC